MIKVSICIPVFNGAKYLGQTIQSALSQDFTDFELLIIDDQSTDDSPSIISEYALTDPRIIYHRNNERLGLVGNWNMCIKKARGEWVKFLFQDDLLAPECLKKMTDLAFRSDINEKIIFCKREIIYEKGCNSHDHALTNYKYIWDLYQDITCISPSDTIKIITKWPAKNVFGEPSSYMIHGSVFKKLDLFDSNFHHICDLEYWLRIGVNMRMLVIHDTLVYFRVHDQSTTNSNRREKYLQMRYLDRLLLFKKFMMDDHFIPLREAVGMWPCSWFLKTQVAIYARRVRIAVKLEKNVNWDNELLLFFQKHHDLSRLARTSYLNLLIRFLISKLCLRLKWSFLNFVDR